MNKGLDNQESESAKDTFTEGSSWIKVPKIRQPERARQVSGVHTASIIYFCGKAVPKRKTSANKFQCQVFFPVLFFPPVSKGTSR